MNTLQSTLIHKPEALAFGTSGLRGLVDQITDLEAYINTKGFLNYVLSLGPQSDTVCIAGDLRPSTHGEDRSIIRAVAQAVMDAGLSVRYLGRIPTPALAFYAFSRSLPSIMVTGSHIPFDRNGIKFCKGNEEVLKSDEAEILKAVAKVRHEEYGRHPDHSIFDGLGMIKPADRKALPELDPSAKREYVRRYMDFFLHGGLQNVKILLYQHSAVGRDILEEILSGLGAAVYSAGRSDSFIPIDTEDIQESRLQELRKLSEEQSRLHGPMDVIVSTDGDSDRPMVVALDNGEARFVSGDLLGLAVALYLSADAAAVPVSINDAVDQELSARGIPLIKTRIGSPYVIEAMNQLRRRMGSGKRIVAWEANGGFLTGSDISRDGRILKALPTRDAVLPILCSLYSAREQGISVAGLVSRFPARVSKAGLLDGFPVETSRKIISRLSLSDGSVREVVFEEGQVRVCLESAESMVNRSDSAGVEPFEKKRILERFFSENVGFEKISRINFVDGVRVTFRNRDVAHLRPSGNAPQMRIYATSDSEERAAEIVRRVLAEPDGILRRMQRDL